MLSLNSRHRLLFAQMQLKKRFLKVKSVVTQVERSARGYLLQACAACYSCLGVLPIRKKLQGARRGAEGISHLVSDIFEGPESSYECFIWKLGFALDLGIGHLFLCQTFVTDL